MSEFKNFYKGKKVFVTGHTGFKGAWMCQWLTDLGALVTGYSIDIPTSPSFFEETKIASKIIHKEGDVRDLPSLKKALDDAQPEIVFHLAAQPLVRDSYDDPLYTFSTNVMGTANILEACKNILSIRSILIITTDKVYENKEWLFGYREIDRLGGKDPYSASKACAELVFQSYFQSFYKNHPHIKILSLRAGNVIGGGDWAKDRLIPDAFRALSKKEKLTIRNPESTRPWQLVLEPLSAYLWSAQMLNENPSLNGESFNFGPEPEMNYSVQNILKEFKKTVPQLEWNVDVSDTHIKKESTLLKLNCEKALTLLGWKPTLNWEKTIEWTAEWYNEYYQAPQKNLSQLSSLQIKKYVSLAQSNNILWAKED